MDSQEILRRLQQSRETPGMAGYRSTQALYKQLRAGGQIHPLENLAQRIPAASSSKLQLEAHIAEAARLAAVGGVAPYRPPARQARVRAPRARAPRGLAAAEAPAPYVPPFLDAEIPAIEERAAALPPMARYEVTYLVERERAPVAREMREAMGDFRIPAGEDLAGVAGIVARTRAGDARQRTQTRGTWRRVITVQIRDQREIRAAKIEEIRQSLLLGTYVARVVVQRVVRRPMPGDVPRRQRARRGDAMFVRYCPDSAFDGGAQLVSPQAEEGLCGAAALYEVLRENSDGSARRIGNGRGSKPLTMNHVLDALPGEAGEEGVLENGVYGQRQHWYTLEQLRDAAKLLGAAYFRAFSQEALHHAKGTVSPIMNETYEGGSRNAHRPRGVTLVVADKHVYLFRERFTAGGHGREQVLPGLSAAILRRPTIADLEAAMIGPRPWLCARQDLAAWALAERVGEEGDKAPTLVVPAGAVHAAVSRMIAGGEIPPVRSVSRESGEVRSAILPMLWTDPKTGVAKEVAMPAVEIEHPEAILGMEKWLRACGPDDEPLRGELSEQVHEWSGESAHERALQIMRAMVGSCGRMSPGVWVALDRVHFSPVGWRSKAVEREARAHPGRYYTIDTESAFPAGLRMSFVPRLSLLDDFRPLAWTDDEWPRICPHGLYYVRTGVALPLLFGNGVYTGTVVLEAVRGGLLKTHGKHGPKITHGCVSHYFIRPEAFVGWTSAMEAAVPQRKVRKAIMNSAIGLARRSRFTGGRHFVAVTSDYSEILQEEQVIADKREAGGEWACLETEIGQFEVAGQEFYTLSSTRESPAVAMSTMSLITMFAAQNANVLLYRNIMKHAGTPAAVMGYATDSFCIHKSSLIAPCESAVAGSPPQYGVARFSQPISRAGPFPQRRDLELAPRNTAHWTPPPMDAEAMVKDPTAEQWAAMPAPGSGDFGQGVLITGGGGCGKTYSLKALLDRLPEGKTTMITATTHSAVMALRTSLGERAEVKTLASAVHTGPNQDPALRRNEWYTTRPDVVVVDEVFMAGPTDIAELVFATKIWHSVGHSAQFILLGDPQQIDPVEGRTLSTDSSVMSHFVSRHIHLTVDRRQAVDDPQRETFAQIKAGLAQGLSIWSKEMEALRPEIVREEHHPRAFAFTNAACDAVNHYHAKKESGVDGPVVFVGQPWYCRHTPRGTARSRPASSIYNGLRMTVAQIVPATQKDPEMAVLASEDGLRMAGVAVEELKGCWKSASRSSAVAVGKWSLGWCATIHRAQGLTIATPYTVYETQSIYADPRKTHGWQYVAATRATRLSNVAFARELPN